MIGFHNIDGILYYTIFLFTSEGMQRESIRPWINILVNLRTKYVATLYFLNTLSINSI